MEQILKRSQQLLQGLRSPLGSAMVLSFVVHLAALPLLADWNPASPPEDERKVALLELTPEELQELPAFAREAAAQPQNPTGLTNPPNANPNSGSANDLFNRLGLGSSSPSVGRGAAADPFNTFGGAAGNQGRSNSRMGDRAANQFENNPNSNLYNNPYNNSYINPYNDYAGWDQFQNPPPRPNGGDRGRRGRQPNGQSRSPAAATPATAADRLAQFTANVAIAQFRDQWRMAAGFQALASGLNPEPTDRPGNYTFNPNLVSSNATQGRLSQLADWVKRVNDLPMRNADGSLLPGTGKELNGVFRDMLTVGDSIQKKDTPIQWRKFADLRACTTLSANPPQPIRLVVLVGDRGLVAPGLNPVRLVQSSGYSALDDEAIAFLTQQLTGKKLSDRPGYLIHIYTLTYPPCRAANPDPTPSPTSSPTPDPTPGPTSSPAPTTESPASPSGETPDSPRPSP